MDDTAAMTRHLNDRLYALLRDLKSSAGDFECECGDDACDRWVQLTLLEYESLRVHRGERVVSPEHD
jgi:hypothetical protein